MVTISSLNCPMVSAAKGVSLVGWNLVSIVVFCFDWFWDSIAAQSIVFLWAKVESKYKGIS